MKVKKWLSVLLSTAIVVSAAVPSEALAKEPANVQRSEERRVGKEC